ncbi:hypothetical protein B0A49_12796 [Cryomyces minteri]|uniref:DNA helicase n=1 Tax=Cryomyces minteri TaxID=331657 RepID=A0A4U0V5C7_9PEZI|nr:hypothetical protein B0A49_12796 [Cryomyces minteri]
MPFPNPNLPYDIPNPPHPRWHQSTSRASRRPSSPSSRPSSQPSSRRARPSCPPPRAGLAILNLQLAAQRTGLGGKTIVELVPDPAVGGGGGGDMAEHGIRVGDVVGVGEQARGGERKRERGEMEGRRVGGVVVRVGARAVVVALDGEEADVEGRGGRLWLCVLSLSPTRFCVKLANDVTYKRMNQTMSKLQKASEAEYTPFIRVLFGLSSPTPVPPDNELRELDWIDPSLNDSQKNAIKFAMASSEVALIHGPPGTGKTHTLIELILQMLKQNLHVLVCGPSNISVDNIVERLAPHKVPMIRLGHPARLLPSVVNHSLDVLTRTSDAAAIVQDIRKEMDDKQASIRKTRNGREKRAIYGEIKELRKEYRERERGCVDSLVKGSKVVLATLHGAGGFHLKNRQFDVVNIDEASQALEAQSSPTIKSLNSKTKTKETNEERDKGRNGTGEKLTLESTLFDRLLALHGSDIKRMLTTQYRMHEKIMAFPSAELYESKLVAAEAVKARLLTDLPYPVEETEDTLEPLVSWDTQGGDFAEQIEGDEAGEKISSGESKSNEAEAAVVRMHVQKLVDAGVKPEDMAVVTPYNAQLGKLSQLLKGPFPGIELGSIDGFQGREKEAVVVSLVRSNAEHEVGFLGEKRRLNVAMTRPKRHLCVVGDSETIGPGSAFLKRWMDFLEANADLRYPALSDVYVGD